MQPLPPAPVSIIQENYLEGFPYRGLKLLVFCSFFSFSMLVEQNTNFLQFYKMNNPLIPK
jgi:hypothetical protein